ncbi:hypothetical protein IX329_000678 [Fusobacterium necrophorum]|uniref:hypothetical protein n=1 Tax=Fusobacterium necrophorum TaxID=859 RepID=UPI00201193BF|nr:hypothetical protein [Fusobacterium necrophorum]MBR8733105.1 hypothetical protein [Fusobacterium necrophorum]MBR8789351.1 hypothetical protein [Fusobacterium necrophorum]
MNLKVKNEMTSLELVEQINFFREQEGTKAKLKHYDLLKIIRNEFSEEIHNGKISFMFYGAKIGNGAIRKQPMYVLTLNQAKQVLLRESKFVRRAVIQYIEKLEQRLKKSEKNKVRIEDMTFEQTMRTVKGIMNNLKSRLVHERDILNMQISELDKTGLTDNIYTVKAKGKTYTVQDLGD